MSLKHVVHKRVHKERAQPQARAKLGYLEKHKDYVKRARDYHKKQDAVKKLHQKAFFKNEDEFAFGMVSSKQVDGKLRTKPKHLSEGELKLLDSQDSKYVGMMELVDKKAAERHGEQLHFLDLDRPNRHTLFLDDDEEPGDAPASLSASIRRKRKLQDYNVAAHFDTHPSLLGSKANRPTLKQLETGVFTRDEELEKAKKRSYRDLFARQERAKKLERVRGELELRNNLRTKGKRQKVADPNDGQAAVYKWQFQRKR